MSRHTQVTFDAHDPAALSLFWRDALGYVMKPGSEGGDPFQSFGGGAVRANSLYGPGCRRRLVRGYQRLGRWVRLVTWNR